MGYGSVVLMLIFSVLLPTADVFSDIFFSLQLFTGYGLRENHPKFGVEYLGVLTQIGREITFPHGHGLITFPLEKVSRKMKHTR